MKPSPPRLWAPVLVLLSSAPLAQDSPGSPGSPGSGGPERSLVVTPASLEMQVGDVARLAAKVVDGAGRELDEEVFFFSRARRSVTVDSEGNVTALGPGEFRIVARTARKDELERLSASVPVSVAFPPIASVEFLDPMLELLAGTTVRPRVRVLDALGAERPEADLRLVGEPSDVIAVDDFGQVAARGEGEFVLVAHVKDVRATVRGRVRANPVQSIELGAPATHVRTGDVVPFEARALGAEGEALEGVPVHFSFEARPDDDLGNGATGQIEQDGRFVATRPGLYTVVAASGGASARVTIRAEPRNVERKVTLVGHGEVLDVHTSDLWVWEGADGRDYAVTGTWGANGDAIFWNVTDPSQMKRVATITVDARTVNDVKVSADGKLCVISREGASSRRNGIVLIDVTDPRQPEIVSTFDDELTGGVHNLFIYEDHVFALSAGRRYDIIDVSDVKNPKRVGSYELDTPGHSIHDVWVVDGIAYSSNWSDGVHMVDVGNGVAGGSPSNPVPIGRYAYPSGWNHAAFPYRSAATGKSYVVAGDEAFPYGLFTSEKPTYPRGWLHFIDFTDVDAPKEVARYQVPEAGTHNLWIEGDVLYAAYYNGGLRVVDISGDLMGDLYEQGREIGWFLPTHHEGVVPNAPMTWGPQPHKGVVFFSDWNSGLWAVKVEPPATE